MLKTVQTKETMPLKQRLSEKPEIGRTIAAGKSPRHANKKPFEPEVVYATVDRSAIVEDMAKRMEHRSPYSPAIKASLTELFEIYVDAHNEGILKSGTSGENHSRFTAGLAELRANVAAMKADSISKEQAKGDALHMGS